MARTRKPLQIPEGFSIEEVAELAAQQLREQRTKYNREHPQVVERQRIRTYRNFLQRHGMVVIEKLPPQPWDPATEKNILQSLREGLRYE